MENFSKLGLALFAYTGCRPLDVRKAAKLVEEGKAELFDYGGLETGLKAWAEAAPAELSKAEVEQAARRFADNPAILAIARKRVLG